MHFGAEIERDRLSQDSPPRTTDSDAAHRRRIWSWGGDVLPGEAIAGLPRDSYCLVGAIGHDFYEGERQGAKGFPRFTDPHFGRRDYADYMRMATERSLERIGVDQFDLLLLHNPDRTGYTSQAVWDGMAALRRPA